MISSCRAVFAVLTLTAVTLASAQQQRIQVQVDGNAVSFPYAQPQYVKGRVLVPLRGVFEQMGAVVGWNAATRTVSATKDATSVDLRIGDLFGYVNGSAVHLDVPAMILNGSTMVPIRFISEALGAKVGWMEAERLVTVETVAAGGEITTPPQYLRRVLVRRDEVIPVALDRTLSSTENRKGDTFTATVRTGEQDYYGTLPIGTKVEGHIAAINAKSADRPALIDLAFDRLLFPNGQAVGIRGTLTALDSQHVLYNADGTLSARKSGDGKDQRMVYAGYGAGAGLLVGVLERRPLEGAILGGVLGYIVGQIQHDQKQKTSDITLTPGTQMGVRVDSEVVVNWR